MTAMTYRTVAGLLVTVVALYFVGKRLLMLYRLGKSAQPVEPGRVAGLGPHVQAEFVEVAAQRKLLKWTVPGIAHFLTFWGFILLGLTIIEGVGALFNRDFSIPFVGRQPWLGFFEDTIGLLVLASVIIFSAIRIQHSPKKEGKKSRFWGSHLDGAWLILFMIFNVVWTLFLYRGVQYANGHFPFDSGAYLSESIGKALNGLSHTTLDVLENVTVVLAWSVILIFLVIVVNSKHLHIGAAIANVAFSRRPRALGALKPVYSGGKLVDFEDPGEDDLMGRGKIEDFTWKGFLDFASCTECGRCQSQCPAWNTDKPLSPKLLIMSLRDHALAKAPYILAPDDEHREHLREAERSEGERPLVGTKDENGVIDPDVLWSCTTCGACVEQCPVDIEHIDHIVDMRRHQMLIESAFPEEAGVMLRNLEHAGDPWGRGASKRMEWAEPLDFEVKVFGDDGEEKIPDDVEYLFWVGCAGSLDEGAQSTTRAVATLLHQAGVNFMVLGGAETCTGDSARRIGNEFLFQMLAQQNVETLNEAGAKRIVVTCAHCFNALANEYPQLGGTYEVVHHTQLLADLVAAKRLTPVEPVHARITYHDACYLGRHNRIFVPPREVLGAIPGATVTEMERRLTRSFCCGAGGARMWMDENLGTRVSHNRAAEALSTKPDVVTAACPFCIVMLTDGVAAHLGPDPAKPVEVVDIAELLLRSVRTPATAGAPAADSRGGTIP